MKTKKNLNGEMKTNNLFNLLNISIISIILILAVIFISGCIEEQKKPPIEPEPLPTELEYTPTNEPIPCDKTSSIDAEYTIIAPKLMFRGSESSVTIRTEDSEGKPVNKCVKVFMASENKTGLFETQTTEKGEVVVSFVVPEELKQGNHEIIFEDGTKTLEGAVKVREDAAIFIETDKPIYKPGQTIQGRILVVNNNLHPLERNVVIEIKDAKGIKIFKKTEKTNILGVSAFELPLATELNFGTWKINANIEGSQSKETLDIRVEKYVLPKFKINLDMEKEWFLVDEEIKGVIDAQYFFGKPVEGKIKIDAYRYIGEWSKYTTFEADISTGDDGKKEFTLKPVEYISGTYGAGGAGSLLLNATVTDTGGHEEKTTKLLKITETDTILQLISDSRSVKPALPFQILVVTKDPDGNPLEKEVELEIKYKIGEDNYRRGDEGIEKETKKIKTENGIKIITLEAPEDTTGVTVTAKTGKTESLLPLSAAYSPGSNFIHIIQTSKGVPNVGDEVSFNVYSTGKSTVYYDIIGSGRTVFSGTAENDENTKTIKFKITPLIAKNNQAKIVAYQVNPNNEVSADTLPFKTKAQFPVNLEAKFSKDKSEPGEEIDIKFNVNSETVSMIGVGIVDESVYALAEGRLNLQQVFDELEKRFMEPQVEIHPPAVDWRGMPYETKGSKDILDESNIQVISSRELTVPEGQKQEDMWKARGGGGGLGAIDDLVFEEAAMNAAAPAAQKVEATGEADGVEDLQDPSRVRQFFPETWYWNPMLVTDSKGTAEVKLTVPDSITTWKMHAVSSSEDGIGMSDSQLVVFQDFFVDSDIPYSVTRGEEFPIKIIIYNYLNDSQKVFIDLEKADWFKLMDDEKKEATVPGNGVSSVEFKVKPEKVGTKEFDITARTTQRADAIKKTIIVEPEGTEREIVENGILGKDNDEISVDVEMPDFVVTDSDKVFVSITPSIVGQQVNGVEDLLGMPYGCGEQNMMFFTPDVLILKYLKETDQLNPEVRAKTEIFINTGYQRELTFRHSDGSFSAFGESDESGSLFLTDFVLWSFSEARSVKEIDENVLDEAAQWISEHQNADGSWDSIGFVCHQEMMGGLSGKYAQTAYTALALLEYGNSDPSVLNKARDYLEENLDEKEDDSYSLAISSLALFKLESDKADDALFMLMKLAKEDENGIYWESTAPQPVKRYDYMPHPVSSQNVEITSYSALALMEVKDARASDAVKWISSQRNSLGGFSSTQDTVMAFRALITAAVMQGRDIDAEISVLADGKEIKEFTVNSDNFDVLQLIEVPQGVEKIELKFSGTGTVNYQVVKKLNVVLPEIPLKTDLELDVEYETEGIEVNDMISVNVRTEYTGFSNSTGMMLIDIGVPTGFSPVTGTLDDLLENERITRYEIAGRKVIIYVNDLPRGEELVFEFKMIAKFPVKAQIPDSRAYSYYKPEVKGEVKGAEIEVKINLSEIG